MPSNETTTEYRAVGIWREGGRVNRHEGNWLLSMAEAEAVAGEWFATAHEFVIEARDISPVREVKHVG